MTGESALIDAVAATDATPAHHMRLALALCRRRGWPFAVAWTTAKRTMPRGRDGHATAAQIDEWRDALDEIRHVWRAAYERRSVPPDALAGGTELLGEVLDLATDA